MHYNISLEFRMSFLTVIREMKKKLDKFKNCEEEVYKRTNA